MVPKRPLYGLLLSSVVRASQFTAGRSLPDRAVDEHSLMVPASPFLLHRDDGNDLHVTGWPKTKLGLDFPAH